MPESCPDLRTDPHRWVALPGQQETCEGLSRPVASTSYCRELARKHTSGGDGSCSGHTDSPYDKHWRYGHLRHIRQPDLRPGPEPEGECPLPELDSRTFPTDPAEDCWMPW